MSVAVRHAVSATANGIGGRMRQLCLPTLVLVSALQIGEILALQFGQSMLAYGLGFAVIAAGAGAIVVGRIFKPAADGEMTLGIGALDACKSNVMVADASHKIVYLNEAMMETLRAAEAEIRKDIPAFNVGTLVGAKLGAFYKHAADARAITGNVEAPFETELKAGSRTFHLLVTPILGQRREASRNGA